MRVRFLKGELRVPLARQVPTHHFAIVRELDQVPLIFGDLEVLAISIEDLFQLRRL